MSSLSINTKFESLPRELQKEVSDFIDFLAEKSAQKTEKIVPQFGSLKGKIHMSADFDEPLEDFKDYM